jgi:hypothetical protein
MAMSRGFDLAEIDGHSAASVIRHRFGSARL